MEWQNFGVGKKEISKRFTVFCKQRAVVQKIRNFNINELIKLLKTDFNLNAASFKGTMMVDSH